LHSAPRRADSELAGLASIASTDYSNEADDEAIVSLVTAMDIVFESFVQG
jgi:hypothetical protein